jgi:hypothetical protein
MTPDPIKQAIAMAVEEFGQGQALNDKVVAWFEQLVSGNTTFDDKDAVRKLVELLYDATDLPESSETAEEE